MTTGIYVGAALASYFVGAIPFGFLVFKWVRGGDIRQVGSGNIGATNIGRELGAKFFLLVLLLDIAKGFGPAMGGWFLAQAFPCPT